MTYLAEVSPQYPSREVRMRVHDVRARGGVIENGRSDHEAEEQH